MWLVIHLLLLLVVVNAQSCVPRNNCTLSLSLLEDPACVPSNLATYNESYLNSLSNNTFALMSSGCDDCDVCTHNVCNYCMRGTNMSFSCGCEFPPILDCCRNDSDCSAGFYCLDNSCQVSPTPEPTPLPSPGKLPRNLPLVLKSFDF